METYFSAASDEALLALLQNEWIAILSRYRNSNSRACIAALGGSPDSTINFVSAFPGWDASKDLELADLVMRTGASKVARPVNQAAAGEDLQRIFKSLAATYGNDLQLLDKQNEWMNNSAKVCDILLTMYQQIAALPTERAANIVRYLVTTKSPNSFDQFDAMGQKSPSSLVGERYPQTRLRLLSADDLKGMSVTQLRYAINEVYARYGAPFSNNPDIRRQFQKFSWYHPNPNITISDIDQSMSEIEKENIKLLGQYRAMLRSK
jgi:hypothetical protein